MYYVCLLAVIFFLLDRKENPDEREGTGVREGREAIIKTHCVRKESLVDEKGKLKANWSVGAPKSSKEAWKISMWQKGTELKNTNNIVQKS